MPQQQRNSYVDGQQALLYALIDYFGGPSRLARRISVGLGIPDFPRQYFVNWAVRGKVPLYRVKRVASILRISPYALNYTSLSKMENEVPPWKEVVNSINFLTAEQKRKILRLADPEVTT